MESTLCSDAIFEILTRTSLTTLDVCRSTCKDWNKLAYDSSFLKAHGKRTKTISGYFIQSLVSNKHKTKFASSDESTNISLDFLPSDAKIEATSDQGILVYVSKQSHHVNRYYVCQPSTKQVVALPNPKMRYLTEKVVLVVLGSNPLHYKVIRLSWPKQTKIGYTKYRCEIFHSMTWAWKEARDVVLPHGVFLQMTKPAICAIYFLTHDDRMLELRQDLETQYCFLPLPTSVINDSNYKNRRLVKHEGKLGFCCKAPNKIDIFEL